MVEALVGEMTDTMERLRWNHLESRSNLKPSGGVDPSAFPRTYDRIHMSNIPDYVGGLMNAALYAQPLLRDDKAAVSNLQFTVLLNPPEFKNHEHFQSEYLLLHDMKQIQDHFAMKRLANYHGTRETASSKESMLQSMRLKYPDMESMDFVVEGYIVWGRCHPVHKKLRRGSGLLPRPALEKWLYAFFLKICVPYIRPKISGSPVHSPWNLTALLRLVAHLGDIGYPAHWLSAVLSSICSGSITTTARPPKRLVTSPSDVDAASPPLKIVTSPWAVELSTLVSIWSKLFPFGLVTPQPGTLVSPSEITEFSVTFPSINRDTQLRNPQFVLLFWQTALKGQPSQGAELHDLLSGDDEEDLKRDSIHIITTAKFNEDGTSGATFWCRSDVVQQLQKEGGWEVFFLRTDSWTLASPGVKVENSVTMKRRWVG